ncbi:GlpF Glycerol uptake facilitator [Pyrenophora tritici-repentis]|uniref:Major intrinsic protein n=2 Tax=Pyrenophora tritici-repentis TaxID=45151 RepID=A0A2W1HBC3_9PLEO|nr:aquaporin-5 [Pyrenophora tritici-repentis Pt-1C-BFP]KAA8619841.1 GlpF Glycerol uptake facilitator and related permease [Pyrenophora tritici-repentis]EDU46910.1 aquaporin-5 [Pyrenophora tritici-repentis Pt-1C-BFP]KAF7447983.1 GlpF Glycerol uptake facilitator [Pyrenophora tritici-repentis]KAI0572130.1 GlpF Glycerol uptake facilitator and related permease (Major Intrinsic Protein Family) [Pyrenophora tritici-repentis]KAI1517388.1 Major intrinsic protein [Pyrenophora tritici-repentis]
MALKNILPLHRKDPSSTSSRDARSSWKTANRWRIELIAATSEFAGTFMFLFFAFGGTSIAQNSQEAMSSSGTAPNTSVLLYISLIFGFSLMVNVWIFFRVSGGLFNPTVSLGLYLINIIPLPRAIFLTISQLLAGIAAAAVVSAILPGPLNASTTLQAGMTPAQGVFLEMFMTSFLVFTIFMLAAEKHKATFLAPIGIGLSLFVAELLGAFYTGGSLNPARSLGPAVVTRSFPSYHYVYWAGPVMGTLLAWAVYKLVKVGGYQTVNPGQDFDDNEMRMFDPPEHPQSEAQVERPNVAAEGVADALRVGSRSERGISEEGKENING